ILNGNQVEFLRCAHCVNLSYWSGASKQASNCPKDVQSRPRLRYVFKIKTALGAWLMRPSCTTATASVSDIFTLRISSVPSRECSPNDRPWARNNCAGDTTVEVKGSTTPRDVHVAAVMPSSSRSSR